MKKSGIVILLLLIPTFLFAMVHDFRFRHLSVENGLSSNSVHAILQDKYGFLWFGTDEGLDRYDGTTFKSIFFHPRGSLQYISALFDGKDKIWVGTDEGMYTYDYDTESLSLFDVSTANQTRITTTIYHITQDKDGNLWFSTREQGIFRYTPSQKKLEQYEFREAEGAMASVLVDSDNQIWAVTCWSNTPIYKLNKATHQFEPFPLYQDHPNYTSHSLIMIEDSAYNLWLGTWNCGLQRITRDGHITTYLHPSKQEGTMHIHSVVEYAPHQLLIGSDEGLLLFNTITEKFRLFTEDETSPYSLSNRFVYPILKDREGGIWIGTYYGGINYISPNAGQFESYAHSRFSNSIQGTIVSRFCEDSNGNIYIASDDGGLNFFNPKTQHFEHYMPAENKNSLSYHNVHALCMDGDNLWVGTYTGGVNILNTKTGKFKVYSCVPDDENTLDGTSSYAIFKDKQRRIWVTSMIGVNLYNRENDNFTRLKRFDALTMDIDQDNKENIWFSTQGRGLFKYNPEKMIWKNYTNQSNTGSLINNNVNCVLIDENGEIWVGTITGLCKYNPKEDNFTTIALHIPSPNICSIIKDQQVLWLTTTKGLIRYSPGESSQVFTRNDGLQSEQFLPNAGLKASDGKIYIGTVNGFNAFYPSLIKKNHLPPPVIITGLEVFNDPVEIGGKLLPKALNVSGQLDLSYKDNVFSLLYASLSYCTPEKNQYAYQLEGFDKEWNYVGSQTKATYTNLPAGTYHFKVKATNNDGVWNEQEATLKIVIHPPFYWCTASKILYLCIVILFFGCLVHFILKRTEKKHAAEINRLNANREKEVHEAKIKFFTTIAHEIRTPVSLIIGPLEKLMKSGIPLPSIIREDLNIIDRNSQRLLFLVNQLLDFRKVEQEAMQMKFSKQNMSELLEAVCERFEPYISQRGAHLEVVYPNSELIVTIDSEAITKLISNLLTNASKYTKDKIVLSCTVHLEQRTFTIRVTDNGIGIKKEDHQKIFEPFYQALENKPGTGIGLNIVKTIVELHHGCIEVESEVGKGSSFIVTLPIEQTDEVLKGESEADIQIPIISSDTLSECLSTNLCYKPNMLIVDDNQEMLDFLSTSFSEKYNIITAEDGIEALQKLKENDVTLIISDWMMPRMNGVEFCQTLRTDHSISHIPFILLTARTDINSKIEGMDCGADAYIEKPFSVEYLEACIKNLIDLRNLLRQKFTQMPLIPLNSVAGNPTDKDFLTRMNQIIEENFSKPELSVDFLAEQLCISRSGLFAKIKLLTNVTPNELIQVMRLKKAAGLLLENKYRISEICYMVGFNNPSYFAKCFQKQFGIKPGEFASKTHT